MVFVSLWFPYGTIQALTKLNLSVRGKEVSVLEVWNAWSMGGVDTSWIGNSGIVTKPSAKGQLLQCSDGDRSSYFLGLGSYY